MAHFFLFFPLFFINAPSYTQASLISKTIDYMHHDTTSLLFFEGKLVSIFVAKALYESSKTDYFYIRVEVKNTTKNEVALDIQNPWNIFYPNQWGIYPNPERLIIDEEMMIPTPLSSAKKVQLKKNFKAGELQVIPPNSSFVYYTAFNASDKKDVQSKENEFFILSLDGQLIVSNGHSIEQLTCHEEQPNLNRELILSYPILWKKINNEALIIAR